MAMLSFNDIEKNLSHFTVEELLELEEKIMKVVKKYNNRFFTQTEQKANLSMKA